MTTIARLLTTPEVVAGSRSRPHGFGIKRAVVGALCCPLPITCWCRLMRTASGVHRPARSENCLESSDQSSNIPYKNKGHTVARRPGHSHKVEERIRETFDHFEDRDVAKNLGCLGGRFD